MNPTPNSANHSPILPTFIGIGAARSGTTWLSHWLSQHPDIWIPHLKELHYFSRSSKYFSTSFLGQASLPRRLFGRDTRSKEFHRQLARAIGRNIRHPSSERLRWEWKYFLSEVSDEWYESLFVGRPEPITGEITPAYALLDDADAANMQRQLPNTKFLYIMRDPVDRAWSSIRYHEKRSGSQLTSMSASDIEKHLSNDAIVGRSDFAGTIQRWRQALPQERFWLGFYDDIVKDPIRMLTGVYEFLGADVEAVGRDALKEINQKVNDSTAKEMPVNIRRFLSQQYLPALERLAKDMHGWPEKWYQDALTAAG